MVKSRVTCILAETPQETVSVTENWPYDRRWYIEPGLGLNSIAVTAPVCPRNTEIGSPSGKRH